MKSPTGWVDTRTPEEWRAMREWGDFLRRWKPRRKKPTQD